MKLTSIFEKFHGDRKARAQAAIDAKVKELAANPNLDASLDAVSVGELNNLLDVSGRSTQYVEQQIEITRRRAASRATIAGAEDRERAAQSAKDRAHAEVQRLERELDKAKAVHFEAVNGYQDECRRTHAHRQYLFETAPDELRARYAAAATSAPGYLNQWNIVRLKLEKARPILAAPEKHGLNATQAKDLPGYVANLEAQLVDLDGKAKVEAAEYKQLEADILAA